MKLTRRSLLEGSCFTVLGGSIGALNPTTSLSAPTLYSDKMVVDDVERRTFDFFWRAVNRKNGLIPDRYPTPSNALISSVGFALVAYGVGVERGWIRRDEARGITLKTLRFFDSLPMDDAPDGVGGYRGFFYQFLNFRTGLRADASTILSPIDVALLHLGFLYAAEWYDSEHPDEVEIRRLAMKLIDAAQWDWYEANGTNGLLPMGWDPKAGFNAYRWSGYSEAKGMYLLAMGSRTHPINPQAWSRWTASFDKHWVGSGKTRHLGCAPLFTHQYSEMWIDFRGIQDPLMMLEGLDYFENGRRATYENRAYCIRNPMRWRGYSENIWGLTGSNGPADLIATYGGVARQFRQYTMRGPDTSPGGFDDGTIGPTASVCAIACAPEIAIPAIYALRTDYGKAIYRQLGFVEAFNPSFTDRGLIASGRVFRDAGWVDDDYFSLDQGPIVGTIANHKNEGVWRTMRKSEHLRRALQLAKFRGGWLVKT